MESDIFEVVEIHAIAINAATSSRWLS